MSTMGNNIDWDALYEKLDKKDKKYEEWGDFQRRILKPAQAELEEKSDIKFDFEPLRENRKVKRILFTIYINSPSNIEVIDERRQFIEANKNKINRQLEMPMDIDMEFYEEFVGHNNLTKEDIDLLIMRAQGDTTKVRDAINLADKQPSINNYMGWLISCIENGYKNPVTVVDGSADRGEVVSEIMSEYRKVEDSMGAKVWEKVKKKDDYEGFVAELWSLGLEIERLEAALEPYELFKMYTDWKMGEGVNL